VTGPQVRSALGLRDTWFTHYRIGSTASRARSARPASWGPRPPMRSLSGRFQPAPRTRVLVIERRLSKRWQRAARVRTARTGRYRIALSARGLYRVRYGAVTGPGVRVR
jgi:hypothetical protein